MHGGSRFEGADGREEAAMTKHRNLALVTVLTLLYFASFALAQVEYQYIGVEKCAGRCHSGEKKGAQLEQWQETRHAQAYATLGTAKAKEFAAARGITDPQKSDECLQCHVAGHGLSADRFTADYRMEEGVTCENCHGPGSKYKSLRNMKSRDKFLAAGGIIPTEEVCLQCHNEKSPSYKPFDFDEYFAKVDHPIPEKE